MRPPVDDAVVELQREWEVTRYQTPPGEREKRFEALAAKAHQTSEAFPDRAEPLIWEGIIVSSLAGEKGGLGALGLVKQARALYEQAIQIDANALDGSAYNSLGVLYYKVPRLAGRLRRQGQGRRAAAEGAGGQSEGHRSELLLWRVPRRDRRRDEAIAYLERALQAPARPGRQIADAGRREEARALLEGQAQGCSRDLPAQLGDDAPLPSARVR